MGAPRREPPAALSSRVVSGKMREASSFEGWIEVRSTFFFGASPPKSSEKKKNIHSRGITDPLLKDRRKKPADDLASLEERLKCNEIRNC